MGGMMEMAGWLWTVCVGAWLAAGVGLAVLAIVRLVEEHGWGGLGSRRVWRAQLARLLLRVTGRLVAWVEALQPRGKECDGG